MGRDDDFNLMTRRTVCLPGVVALREVAPGPVSRAVCFSPFRVTGNYRMDPAGRG
ncbi:hypothetical protein [Klebsiella quasipneumoniae]|uniref:hypothetical protein n=1 Tax=Klebsiella quasipneumoniae TaxID=1463165 RepID=UPI00388D9E6B